MDDLPFAIGHHLLAFAIAAILAAEWVAATSLNPGGVARLQRLDRYYGVAATLLIIVGILRVLYAGKGTLFYTSNPIFWAKMAAFGLVGLLSIAPTVTIMHWGRKARSDAGFLPRETELARLRRWIAAELVLFVPIPIFAAMMARGVGL
jgi:putative membrane protein